MSLIAGDDSGDVLKQKLINPLLEGESSLEEPAVAEDPFAPTRLQLSSPSHAPEATTAPAVEGGSRKPAKTEITTGTISIPPVDTRAIPSHNNGWGLLAGELADKSLKHSVGAFALESTKAVYDNYSDLDLAWLFADRDKKPAKEPKPGEVLVTEEKNADGKVETVKLHGKTESGDKVDAKVDDDSVTLHYCDTKSCYVKKEKASTYEDKSTQGAFKDGVGTLVDKTSGQNIHWDTHTHSGYVADKDGNKLYEFTSKGDLEHWISKHRKHTQVQDGSAVNAADEVCNARRKARHAAAEQSTEQPADPVESFSDRRGNISAVTSDNLRIDANKDGLITISKDDLVIEYKDHKTQMFRLVKDANGKISRVPISEAEGVTIDEATGAVTINGKKIIDEKGAAHIDSKTAIHVHDGKVHMDTESEGCEVQVTAAAGSSQVQRGEDNTITADENGYSGEGAACPIHKYDPKKHAIEFGNGKIDDSGVTITDKKDGKVIETKLLAEGGIEAYDITGGKRREIYSINRDGELKLFNGTTVDKELRCAKYKEAKAEANETLNEVHNAIAEVQGLLGNLDFSHNPVPELMALYGRISGLMAGFPRLAPILAGAQGTISSAMYEWTREAEVRQNLLDHGITDNSSLSRAISSNMDSDASLKLVSEQNKTA